ncbi:hypothetical protein CCO02nite_14050 [Cellulomonas composti]|uniref:Uridine kinase n=1 Tax=Cellulomonas composti TaxID=266130 RepID=A0A511J9S6_9CELL|nr:hypothetical protein CCO02nite_14050 [Cellulomonas composti]
MLARVAERVPDPTRLGRPVRVGVDGTDGAGKTWFADELADVLRTGGTEVVRVSIDGFHRPRSQRYARGADSPEGYFLDSYDLDRFRADVLDPFAPDGSCEYRTAAHDVRTDEALDPPRLRAGRRCVLLVDGIFLHRDELVDAWDLSVYLAVPTAVTYARMAVRDGCPADPADPANRRYVQGQRLYDERCAPAARAHLVVDNTDLAAPTLRPDDERPALEGRAFGVWGG